MYKIIGADQKEYGPVTSDQIRQWVAEGRADAQTKVLVGTDWKPLGEVPEFTDVLRPQFPPLRSAPAQAIAQPTAPVKTSGLAITSLVCGILGLFTCGVTALVGLILGIVSMVKIKNSHGRLGGLGIAVGGTVVSALFLLVIPAMLLPALAGAKRAAQTVACTSNMKQLALAVLIYSGDNNELFPSADKWCDAVQTNVGSLHVFHCPGAPAGSRCDYAFNAKLGGMNERKISPNTVMLFEADSGWNQSGGQQQLLEPSRHRPNYVVALVDGSVLRLSRAQLSSLRWDP